MNPIAFAAETFAGAFSSSDEAYLGQPPPINLVPITPTGPPPVVDDEPELEIHPCPTIARLFAHGLLYMVQIIWFIFQYIGLPWMYLALPLWQQEPTKTSVLLAEVIVGFSYPLNVVIALVCLHSTGVITSFGPYQAAIVGWSVGMLVLRVGLGLYSRAAIVEGRDGGVAEAAFDSMLLKPFGLNSKHQDTCEPDAYTKPLIVLLFAQAFFVLSSWYLNPHTEIECFAIETQGPDIMQEITWKPHDNNSVPVMWKPTSSSACSPPLLFAANLQSCCRIKDTVFDLFAFLANVGGNAVVGYMMVKYIGLFLKWNTIKKPEPTSNTGRTPIGVPEL
jgi:hypothetical protein